MSFDVYLLPIEHELSEDWEAFVAFRIESSSIQSALLDLELLRFNGKFCAPIAQLPEDMQDALGDSLGYCPYYQGMLNSNNREYFLYTTVGMLNALVDERNLSSEAYVDSEKAAFAYLRQLSTETKVVVYSL